MAQYEYLMTKGFVSVIRALFQPEPEPDPIEWLFEHYTQKGYYFYLSNGGIQACQIKPPVYLELWEIQSRCREFMKCVTDLV